MQFIVRLPRCTASGALALILLASSAAGQPAEFQPQLASPQAMSHTALKARFRDRLDRAATTPLAARVRNTGAEGF